MTTAHAASAHRIAVGIVGSRSSVAALDWAPSQASEHCIAHAHSPVLVVRDEEGSSGAI